MLASWRICCCSCPVESLIRRFEFQDRFDIGSRQRLLRILRTSLLECTPDYRGYMSEVLDCWPRTLSLSDHQSKRFFGNAFAYRFAKDQSTQRPQRHHTCYCLSVLRDTKRSCLRLTSIQLWGRILIHGRVMLCRHIYSWSKPIQLRSTARIADLWYR